MIINLTLESYLSFTFQLATALIFTAFLIMAIAVGCQYAWKLGKRLIRRVDVHFNRAEKVIKNGVEKVKQRNIEVVKRKNGAAG